MILRPNQNGFRNNRSTVGQILTVRRIIEGVKEKNIEASLMLHKCCSSKNSEKLLNVLEESGKTVGLKVNIKNTQHMNINSNKTVTSINVEVLKNVDNLIYLGSEIESTDKELKIRIAKSRAALDKLSSI